MTALPPCAPTPQLPGSEPHPPLSMSVVLNPLSRAGQRLGALLPLLREALGAGVVLWLNPPRELTEMPLKSYYR